MSSCRLIGTVELSAACGQLTAPQHPAACRSRPRASRGRGGTAIVLVSSSPRIVIEPLSVYLGCTDVITTPVVIERGRLVGIGSGPACYGEGKLYWAEQWAAARGITMDEAVAYADNWSDRALLQRVGKAVVVRPHRKLSRYARQRGWHIVRPKRPRLAARRPDVAG